MTNSFGNKVAVVTAGGAGIGRAHAKQLADAGATVHIIDLNEAAVHDAANQIGPRAIPHIADVTNPDHISEVVDAVLREHSRIDTWTNTVGYFKPTTSIDEITLDLWRRTIDVNLTSAFVCSKAAAQVMTTQAAGSIVNVASGAGLRARVPVDYSVAKAAVIHLSRSLALEFAGTGVRVNVVAPGYTNTKMTDFLSNDPEALDAFVNKVPMRRLAEPSDIAEVLTFVHSDRASFMTGSVVAVDGGSTLI